MELRLDSFFQAEMDADASTRIAADGFRRIRWRLPNGVSCALDDFADAACCFIRIPAMDISAIAFSLEGGYRLRSVAAGGWLLASGQADMPLYWIPRAPILRLLDSDGHIIREAPFAIEGMDAEPHRLSVRIAAPKESFGLDLNVWRLSAGAADWPEELDRLLALELQPCFIYGSHTVYQRPGDVYAHLLHGHVYDTQFVWPRYWKIADELDAYALYLILSGLELATGKRLYGLLKRQVLYSVIDRQGEDGAWRHGEWTDGMECHARLHCGGIHLLAAALEESGDPVARRALERAVAFVAKLTDETAIGAWFLHDTLELSGETMDQGPFPWRRSRVLGKSESNMLVLNTHLDTLIALGRYRRLTGDGQYDGLIASGRRAAAEILARRPMEALYSLCCRLIDLTWLPVEQASRLPLPWRALKRLAWKYLMPRMHLIRTRWPRLAMPNGYIDRAISLAGVSHAYQTVNLWDIIRYRRCFAEQAFMDIVKRGLDYTQGSALRDFWLSQKDKGHALGFWVDALWHLCMDDPEPKYRRWLAEGMLYCAKAGFGMPPALLGGNAEAIPPNERCPCPSPTDLRLRIANLSRAGRIEIIVANPSGDAIVLELNNMQAAPMQWASSNGEVASDTLTVPANGWLWGTQRP
jgi:hypothetical protein